LGEQKISLDLMFEHIYEQSRLTPNSWLDDIAAQFKETKKLSTLLDRYGLDPSKTESTCRLIDEWKTSNLIKGQKLVKSNLTPYDISRNIIPQIITQIESPLKNFQKLVQSNLIPYGISRSLISQIESLLKTSRNNSYYSYYSGTNRNYYRGRGTSSTRSNDSPSQERTSSQTASKSQTKEQNSSSQVTNKYKKSAAPKNKVVKLRRNATAQFKVLDEINSRVINNNNNPVEWRRKKNN
jgi:hypothetical protein